MSRTQDAEVAMIKLSQLRIAEPFHDREDSRVHDVQDQRHGRVPGPSSPARRAVSVCPDAPIPMLRERGR
jgi:hypothetical protein